MKNITDSELYELCKKFGKRALEARRKFSGLLPEVFKRRLYEKKGFSSIYEFAAKLAGMSHDQVDLVLRLERKFEDKPILQKALTEGEISANKLIRIASIATVKNQEEIFEKAKILSKRAIEVFVRDVKYAQKNEEKNGSNMLLFGQKVLPGHGIKFSNGSILKLDADIKKELTEMQEKGIDINKFLREVLKKRKENIKNEKLVIAEAQRREQEERDLIGVPPKEYMSVKIKRIIHEEHGTKCSVPRCTKPAKTLHHTGRFALTKSHDPHFIAPLCEEHHEIAHKIDLRYLWKSMAGGGSDEKVSAGNIFNAERNNNGRGLKIDDLIAML